MATWAIQANLLDNVQISQITDALTALNIAYVPLQVIPFCDDITYGAEPPKGHDVIPYGSAKLSKLAQKMGWTGMFFDLDKFRVDTWNANRSDMLNDDARVMLVSELNKEFETIDDMELFFIRPVEDLKAFNGTLTVAKEIRRWMSSVESGNFSFNPDTPVIVARPKNILAEWRWFIVDGKVVSGSTYKMHGQRLTQKETDQDVIDEAQEMANQWLPNKTCVMDVGLTKDGPKVIEFNCFNSSGFYYHDISAVVKAVTEYVDGL